MVAAEVGTPGSQKQVPLASLFQMSSNPSEAAAKVLEKRAKMSRRWRTDHSSFSALNVDCSRSLSHSSPFADLVLSGKATRPLAFQIEAAEKTEECSMQAPPSKHVSAFSEVRKELLDFRGLADAEVPAELSGLTVAPGVASQAYTLQRQESEPVATTSKPQGFMRQMSAQVERSRSRSEIVQSLPSPSANAYAGPRCRAASLGSDLRRTVQGLLNKICPENVASIVHKIAAVEVHNIEDLETIIELIFKKAISEPHYCATYADLVFSLKTVYPEFPSQEGGRPLTLKSLVLNICQNEFEELLASADLSDEEKAHCDEEELEMNRHKRKERMRANMKFIGHLFLRQLLSAKVIGSVICELVLCEQAEELPEEHALDCACELITAIGYTLEALPVGKLALKMACDRLKDLKGKVASNGKTAYSKRIQFMIQDLLDTRAAGWSKKVFKSAAKTKEEIRMEQEKDLRERARGKQQVGEHVVAGQRPEYLAPALDRMVGA
eukprot:TRINITY_DN4152_c0_g2_i1.p1 TRINITY_DN4152_c0_g2~~TRINITY_DN4152_c0_g2_i1.p1  ORF type:complete len:496 (-),score=133.74 TRINITY_DN4152_c0_g2_i1:23-1510(-)